MENQPWDGIDRRKADASLGVTALNIAARGANAGKLEVDDIFGNTGGGTTNIVREVDYDNDPLKSRVGAVLDAAKEDPRLTRYKEQYNGSGNPKLKVVPWTTIQARILEDESFQLRAALDLEQGGELFGIDKEGNPLISDGGDEPVMKGMNYKNTRDRVRFKHTSNDIAGTIITGENGQPIATGYEMFGYVEPNEKSDEIKQYEAHTGRKFVQNDREWRSSWLESGENPSWPRLVDSSPRDAGSGVDLDRPQLGYRVRGVRRLLRVKKKA